MYKFMGKQGRIQDFGKGVQILERGFVLLILPLGKKVNTQFISVSFSIIITIS